MRKFTPVLQSLLEDRYEDKSNTSIMNINYIGFQMFDRITQQLFESYENMKILVINHCDLRNLENFPKLLCLTDLNLANNSLQGSFNNIMKCKKLSYMDISCNLILDVSKLQPLRKIPHLSLYLKNNPFTERQGWNLKIKSYKLKIIKDPKKFPNEEKSKQKQKQKNKIKNQCKLEDKKQKLIQEIQKQEKIEKNKQQINIINIQPEANQGSLKDIDQNQQPFKDIQMLIKTDLFSLNNPGNIFLHKNILDDNSENDQLKEINHFEHFSQHDDQDDLINDGDGDEDIDEDDDSIDDDENDDDDDDDDISLDDDNDEQQQQY